MQPVALSNYHSIDTYHQFIQTMIRSSLLAFSLLACSTMVQAQVDLCYCDTTLDHGFGTADELYTPYLQLDAQTLLPYAGNEIRSIKVGLRSDVTNVTIYIKNTPQDKSPLYSQKVGELTAGWNTIELTTPFTIANNDKPLSIGYRARLKENSGLAYSTVRNPLGAAVYLNKDSKWSSIDGTFSLMAHVEGDQMPQCELALGKLYNQRIEAGTDSLTLTSAVKNMGVQLISNYTLRCEIDGEEITTQTFEHDVPTNATDSFALQIPVTFGTGTHTVSLELVAANGQADAYAANNVASATLTMPDERFARMVVCEEFTGHWCGWCPRGYVGLEMMTEKYPDRFIGVAVHGGSNDPLEVPADSSYSYQPFISSFTGAPNCSVNRRLKGDPFYDIANIYTMETRAENHVACTMTAQWNEEATAIDLKLTGIVDVDMDKANYNAAFILLEDSITGYPQANYYANESNPFYGWESRPAYVTDLVYNNLARGCFPTFDGQPLYMGSLTGLEEFSTEYSLPIPPTVKDRRYVHVVGLIIDNRNGFVQNSSHRYPEGEIPQAIRNVEGDKQAKEVRFFDLQGRLVEKPAPGQIVIKAAK